MDSPQAFPTRKWVFKMTSLGQFLAVFTIELPAKSLWASLYLEHDGGHTKNTVGVVS
jgi:hypothetical protein